MKNSKKPASNLHPTSTEHNRDNCQDNAKTVRVRSGMGTANYWKSRLYRNTYKDRKGATVDVPEYYVRMRYAGITRQVRLDHSNRDTAADQALELFNRVQVQGWRVVDDRKAHLPASASVAGFLVAYEKATKSMERAPRPITVRLYSRCLLQLCRIAGVKNIRELTTEKIERARDKYRAAARGVGRDDASIRNTLSNITRNAGACFSREARTIMQRNGLTLENPFTGIKCGSDIQQVSPLPRAIVERIWADAPKLRDGDPNAKDPKLDQYIRRYKKTHEGREPGRWVPVDFSEPHVDAYAALLLAFGCGLRANECDKCRWSWLSKDDRGDCFIEVRKEADFIAKGGSGRIVKIPANLYEALLNTRQDAGEYVIGGRASTESSMQGGGLYRRPNTFRVVNEWLRSLGVEAGKKYGKPLHALRKQFGSAIATEFGLFHAQKLLGHGSPTITARHYASQVDLPTLSHVRLMG